MYAHYHEENTEEDNNGYVVLNEVSNDQLGNIVMLWERGLSPSPTPFYSAGFRTDIFRRCEQFSLNLGYFLHAHFIQIQL